MKPGIRSRINILNRATMVAGLLVAGLVIVASRLPVNRPPALWVSSSPVPSGRQPTPDATQRAVIAVPQPMASPTQPATVSTTGLTLSETPATPEPTLDVSNRIGILAGHLDYDSGAICSDGLREVDITTDIARRTAEQLRSLGYEVDILQEQDPDKPHPPLQDYRAAAFISLHVDSCLPGASGFKVARWAFSQMPEIEDRLVECIYQEYAAATGLPQHDSSITIDMWNYYAFREIGEPTPGVIIEMGFMTGDRWLLVRQPDLATQGIVNGLLCFLKDSGVH
ncbi:MAG: N-acetylmuramoyl-L-alanine amidase [Anaerolineae bacterium]